MSAYYRFPEYRLASGRYILIEMFTQDISSGIAAPYTDSGGRIDLGVNPWLQGGVPTAKSVAQPILGYLGGEACEFSFAGIDVYAGKSLYELITEQPPDQYLWNIRYYTKASASASYPIRPRFWGIITTALQYGELRSLTRHELNTYKMVAEDRLTLLDRVEVADWSIPWKTSLAIAPAHIYIDGLELTTIEFSDTGSAAWVNADNMRFLSIKEMLNSMADDVALTTTVNDLDTIISSWVFYGKDGTGTQHAYTADDLVIASGTDITGHPIFGTGWFWHFSYFDHEKNGKYSVYNVGTLLEALKHFLVPLGLRANFEVHPSSGTTYIEVREVESRAGVKLRRLLRDKNLSVGENSAKGITVSIAEDTDLSINGSDGEQLDCCYQSASKIRTTDTWDFSQGDARDLHCVYGSLWIYDAANNFVTNVTRIDVKADTRSSLAINSSATSYSTAGQLIGEAAARYYYNAQNRTVSYLGYYRPWLRELECRDYEIRDAVSGTTTNFVTNEIVCTGAFPSDEDTYLHRRVRNLVTGAEAIVTARVDASALQIDADIFPSAGHAFIVYEPRVGDIAYLPDGSEWRITELSVNDREGTTDLKLESECYG
jgi:hypothetical protein